MPQQLLYMPSGKKWIPHSFTFKPFAAVVVMTSHQSTNNQRFLLGKGCKNFCIKLYLLITFQTLQLQNVLLTLRSVWLPLNCITHWKTTTLHVTDADTFFSAVIASCKEQWYPTEQTYSWSKKMPLNLMINRTAHFKWTAVKGDQWHHPASATVHCHLPVANQVV